jgi:ribosomal protein L27
MVGSEMIDVITLPSMDPEWRTAGAGDFDGDGTTDILWIDDDSGTVRIWLMGDLAGDGEIDSQLAADWVIAGVGDFNGDGHDEIAIWNQSSRLEIWGLNGELVRLAGISIRQRGAVAGIGDIDGDGNDDIIFQDHRKRRIEASLMSANFSAQRVVLDRRQVARWDVIDSGDYNGDGLSDLLWRDLSSSGERSAGVLHVSSHLELSEPVNLNLGTNHSVVGTADYDGDGAADLLVFDRKTRELVLWLMAGNGAPRFESIDTVSADWLPVGFNTDDPANQ